MKYPTSLKLSAITAVGLTAAALHAEISINENFAVSGYVNGSAYYSETEGEDTSKADLDSMKLVAIAKFAPLTVTTSLFAFGTGSGNGFNNSPIFLDAYGTYDFGNGTTVTAGKYLSWLGYEAFDIPNMLQISYANPTAAYIPAYHTGVKVEKSTDAFAVGVGVTDSLYGPTYYRGDGDLKDGIGLEAYFTYKAIKDFTLFAGVGYDTGNAMQSKSFVADIWAQYVVDKLTFAAEFCYGSTDFKMYDDTDGYFGLILVKYQFTDKWSSTFRISAGEGDAGDKFTRLTVAPTYAVTKNLDIVTEYSFTDHEDMDSNYLGIQARFKF
jgi:hypothetical protein